MGFDPISAIANGVGKFFGMFNPGGAATEVIKDLPLSTEEKNKKDKRTWKIKVGEYFRERLAKDSKGMDSDSK